MSASETTNESIGIIGIGLLGSVIADRLSEAGLAVYGFDTGTPKSRGAIRCESASNVFDRCATVFLSLPNSSIVSDVVDEVMESMAGNHLIIDTTTGDPEDAINNAKRVGAKDAGYIEATIAGSSDLLRKREAGIFLGGEPALIERAAFLFDILTDQSFHLGKVGAASRFKLVHNLVLGLHRAVLAEALHFGQALGFAPAGTLDVLRQSPAASLVMDTKGAKMVNADYDPPQARLSQHLKDVVLILHEAERAGIRTPLSEIHKALLERAEELGFGEMDTSAVIEAIRNPLQ